MKALRSLPALLGAGLLLMTGCALQPLPQVDTSNITVKFQDPDKFTDVRSSFGNTPDEGYLQILEDHVKKTAARVLPAGEKLAVTFTDIDLAGDILPRASTATDIRIIKDIYRPRMTLTFKLTGADGKVVKEGDRTLVDSFFMNNVGIIGRNEPLYYDRNLLTDWIQKEFKR